MRTPTEADARPTRHRRVLVVGATASFGLPLVERFLAAGDDVTATCRGQAPDGLSPRARHASLDLLDLSSQDRFIAQYAMAAGPFDVVVITAGILPGLSLDAYDDATMDTVMATNVTCQAALLRRLLPHLSDGARVWMTSSISGARGSFDPVYAASKAAIIGLVQSLATWHSTRIRVNAIAPALIESSAMARAMQPERREYHLQQTPTRRHTTADEIAGALFDLCGPAWANLTGQVIHLNGGAHV